MPSPKDSQLNLCSTCGKPIKGKFNSTVVKGSSGDRIMKFHEDAKGCAEADEVRSSKKVMDNDSAVRTLNYRYNGDYND
jgi:hypothetical protein